MGKVPDHYQTREFQRVSESIIDLSLLKLDPMAGKREGLPTRDWDGEGQEVRVGTED